MEQLLSVLTHLPRRPLPGHETAASRSCRSSSPHQTAAERSPPPIAPCLPPAGWTTATSHSARAQTVKEDGRDVVRKVTPARLSALSVEEHRDVIDSHVYPAVEGLTVEAVETEDGKGGLMIGVPAQPKEHKPFLVHGAIAG